MVIYLLLIMDLSLEERQLFDTLLKCKHDHKLDVTFRVCGGWVRDKLLNRESDDVDITLDTLTGREFAELSY